MYALYRKGRADRASARQEDVVLSPSTSSGRSLRTNLLLAVAFVIFVIVVVYAGGDQLSGAIAASGSMVYNSVTGKTAAVPPKAKAKPKKAKQVQVQALKPLGKAPSSSKEDKVKASKDTPKDKAVPAAAKAEAARPAGKPRIITTIEHKGKKLEVGA